MGLQWCWAIVWFVVLILLAWPLGFIAAFLYILISPFAACCACTKTLIDFLHKGVLLPYNVATYMVQGRSCGQI